MTLRLAVAALSLVAASTGALAEPIIPIPGVDRPDRARQNYILKCQGCHGAEASGDLSLTPPMAGMVSQFLSVPGGRNYLARVPGVATAPIDDAALAELLNWTLFRFDAAHVPAGFQPYSAQEMAGLRKAPLRTEAAAQRRALIDLLDKRISNSRPTGK